MNAYFHKQYYFQWSNKSNQKDFYYVPGDKRTKNDVLELEKGTISYYQGKSGNNKNYLPYHQGWVEAISKNMNLDSFPNASCTLSSCRGIIVNNAQVRSLPTSNAFYNDFTTPGEGKGANILC